MLGAGQQWQSFDNPARRLVLQVDTVNYNDGTFAGTLGTVKNGTTVSKFPFLGEFNPTGNAIGWVVSYRNEDTNDNAVGVWTGTARVMPQPEKRRVPILSMNWLLTIGYNLNTTSGFDQFWV